MKTLYSTLILLTLILAPELHADYTSGTPEIPTSTIQQTIANYWADQSTAPEDGWPSLIEGTDYPDPWDPDLGQVDLDAFGLWVHETVPEYYTAPS